MTDQGLASAFRFVRSAVIGVGALIAARVHWGFVVVGVGAYALMAWDDIRWQRAADEEQGTVRPSAWWAGVLLPLGVGVWASFLYLGIKTRTERWIIWAAAYLCAIVLAGYVNVLGRDEDPTLTTFSGLLYIGTWGAGLLHASLVQKQVGTLRAES